MLPKHGKIDCRACFSDSSEMIRPHSAWRMINDPGAWGSDSPEFLVLGFSKGATQAGIYQRGNFEAVAFAGMRTRLTQALQAMGVLAEGETVDQKIRDPNANMAFGSLIRCSVSRRDAKASVQSGSDVFACTGPLISKSFTEIPLVIRTCASRFLTDLPSSVRIVFFLGNTDSYVDHCQKLIQELFPTDFEIINPMAVRANGRLWIHLAHPSGLNGHFNTWLHSDQGAGGKRLQARQAVELA